MSPLIPRMSQAALQTMSMNSVVRFGKQGERRGRSQEAEKSLCVPHRRCWDSESKDARCEEHFAAAFHLVDEEAEAQRGNMVQGRSVNLVEPGQRKAFTFSAHFSLSSGPWRQAAASPCLANVGQVQIHVSVRIASTCAHGISLLRFESQFLWCLLTLAVHLSSSLWCCHVKASESLHNKQQSVLQSSSYVELIAKFLCLLFNDQKWPQSQFSFPLKQPTCFSSFFIFI